MRLGGAGVNGAVDDVLSSPPTDRKEGGSDYAHPAENRPVRTPNLPRSRRHSWVSTRTPLLDEPGSPKAVSQWVGKHMRARDPFAHVFKVSEQHREGHGPGCTVYPTGSGPLLGALVAATGAKRILEVGCGLGYSALWLALGSSPDGSIETIEQDTGHAALARRHFHDEGYAERITVHEGRAAEVMSRLAVQYDFIFCDGDPDEYLVDLDHFLRLLEAGGLLLSSNLFLGQYDPDIPGLEQATTYRQRILDDQALLTAFLPTGLALSVRRG